MLSSFQLGRLALVSLLLASSLFPASIAEAQRQPASQRPIPADTTGESDVYPIGDAVGVYRAVMDLLYVDGKERPSVIVLWDTAQSHWQSGQWSHKSTIDTATILAFRQRSYKRPRIIDFGYRIPIVRISQNGFEQIRNDGYAYLADRPPEKVGPIESFWAGFRAKYPKAWGYAMISKVGFNPQHSEALVTVFQMCGEQCRSNETVFLKRFGKDWKVIERIPDYTDATQTSGNLRYRGPGGERADQSQIVAMDSSGSQPRAESDDAGNVYRVVLDKLYSFYGEAPKSIVLTETRSWAPGELPGHRSAIDSSTVTSYNLYAQLRDAVYPRIKYRIPITWVSDTALKELERQGAPFAKIAADRFEEEQNPLWYGFRAKFPGAWGYASLGRVGFNAAHTQALVFTKHSCGSSCVTSDIWFLERKGDNWYVVERMPRDNANGFPLDGLRCLGPETDPNWYRPRRVHGVITDETTGQPLPKLKIRIKGFADAWFAETDAEGRYSLDNLPVAPLVVMVRCPDKKVEKWAEPIPVYVRPGMDSTMNVKVNFAMCPDQ
ncbi:MAG TPA: carboxypeptidase-like regulatory domain-containing protein [Gemmatimonadaceae bacterium]|nr:carboxypeptidase-like regulatory domain-containing protein [Gemmatimonadaceae bacterium]